MRSEHYTEWGLCGLGITHAELATHRMGTMRTGKHTELGPCGVGNTQIGEHADWATHRVGTRQSG